VVFLAGAMAYGILVQELDARRPGGDPAPH
jgi:hypothetical protein